MGQKSKTLTRDEVATLRKIQDGDLRFVDRNKAERLFHFDLASVASDKHVSLTDEGKKYLQSVTGIGE